MQRDYWYSSVRDWRDLEDGEGIGKRAAQRALRRLNARKLSTTDGAGVVRSRARARPVRVISSARSAAAASIDALRSCSMLRASRSSRRGCRCPSARTFSRHWASSPFDSEGVVTKRSRDRRRRRAHRLCAQHVFGAQARPEDHGQRGRRPQPASCRAAVTTSTPCCKRMGRGLVVTELMGQGVNGVTGDYSRGAAGFWVENGAIAYPGARDHDRRQPEGHVPADRHGRQRRRRARRHSHRLGADRADDHRRRVRAL